VRGKWQVWEGVVEWKVGGGVEEVQQWEGVVW